MKKVIGTILIVWLLMVAVETSTALKTKKSPTGFSVLPWFMWEWMKANKWIDLPATTPATTPAKSLDDL